MSSTLRISFVAENQYGREGNITIAMSFFSSIVGFSMSCTFILASPFVILIKGGERGLCPRSPPGKNDEALLLPPIVHRALRFFGQRNNLAITLVQDANFRTITGFERDRFYVFLWFIHVCYLLS